MAEYCIEHDFLVREGKIPSATASPTVRDTVASILVNQGTTPNVLVQQALTWIKTHWKLGPFDITWYTTGGLVNATLHDFRSKNPTLSIAGQIFLFPGRVNTDMQAVSGPEAEQFVETLDVDFTYAFLSVYAFDVDAGRAQFQYSEEVRLQRACARLYADHKFLFIDSSKFKREGKRGYRFAELLEEAKTVTIYTTTSPEDEALSERFGALCDQLLSAEPQQRTDGKQLPAQRKIRLRIVKLDGTLAGSVQREGFLNPTS